jgi:hypothetical protein
MTIIIVCGAILLLSLLFRIKITAVIIWMAGAIAGIIVQNKFHNERLAYIILGASLVIALYFLFWKGLDK